jgi:predicted nuclease of predicted toxin-antitoxin system
MIRFLIDECLSPMLAETARAIGFDAMHIVWLGRASASDRDVARMALERDYIVVTNNARDFRRIYAGIDLHPGLLLILPTVPAPRQKQLFLEAIAFVEAQPDLINQVLSIDATGAITLEPWSAARRD